MKITKKIQNSTWAIDAAPAAIPPKPKIAAITAIMKNTAAQYNIWISFLRQAFQLLGFQLPDFVSLFLLRVLLTVAATILFAASAERPRFNSELLMCSYCLFRFVLFTPRAGIASPLQFLHILQNFVFLSKYRV
jgi:hypothetical protein